MLRDRSRSQQAGKKSQQERNRALTRSQEDCNTITTEKTATDLNKSQRECQWEVRRGLLNSVEVCLRCHQRTKSYPGKMERVSPEGAADDAGATTSPARADGKRLIVPAKEEHHGKDGEEFQAPGSTTVRHADHPCTARQPNRAGPRREERKSRGGKE